MVTVHRLKNPPPKLVRVGKLPEHSDVVAFKNAVVDDQLKALSYLRYVRSKDSGSPSVSASAVALSVLAICMTVLIAQTSAADLWAHAGVIFAALVLLLGFYAIHVMIGADRSDERRGRADAWLLALEPFYVPGGARSSWLSRKSSRHHR
jgi:hypothetical protein